MKRFSSVCVSTLICSSIGSAAPRRGLLADRVSSEGDVLHPEGTATSEEECCEAATCGVRAAKVLQGSCMKGEMVPDGAREEGAGAKREIQAIRRWHSRGLRERARRVPEPARGKHADRI